MERVKPEMLTLQEYAREKGITLETAFRRVWNHQVTAERIDGRWFICADQETKLVPARGANK